MDIVTIGAIFFAVFLLFLGPYLGFILLRATRKRQHLEYRLAIYSKQYQIRINTTTKNISYEKQTLHKSEMIKVLLIILLVIPPLFMLFATESFYTALSSILFYTVTLLLSIFLIIKMRHRKQIKIFIEDLPNAVDLIIRNLKAGHTIIDAMHKVGEEIRGPVSEQFKNISGQLELGKEFITVINTVSRQLNIPEFSFFALILSVQQETGGNIIKTLNSLAELLRQRQLMRSKIKALSSEGIFSAFFMGGLPFLVAGVVCLIRPEYMQLLLTTSLGQHLLIAGVISEILGCLVIARMVRIDV